MSYKSSVDGNNYIPQNIHSSSEDTRDYLEEAKAIIRGDSMLLCEREHLLALNRVIEELSADLIREYEMTKEEIKNES